MKNSKTKYIYNRLAGFIGYKSDGKNIEIVYTEPNYEQKILKAFKYNFNSSNTGGVQCPTV